MRPNPRESFHQTARQEDDDQHEENTECQVPTFADKQPGERYDWTFEEIWQEAKNLVQRLFIEGREDVFEILDECSAKNRPEKGACATKNGHENDLARCGPLHTLSAREWIG